MLFLDLVSGGPSMMEDPMELLRYVEQAWLYRLDRVLVIVCGKLEVLGGRDML